MDEGCRTRGAEAGKDGATPGVEYDFAIIGSGFGGSVAALRLAEKGYRVVVLEKGDRFGPADFPTSNWQLPRWMWLPALGWRGLFQMTFLRHMTVLSGVGVGGGSLVYANTLPEPNRSFFEAPSWRHLADWQRELRPHYETARRMLGVAPNPRMWEGDRILEAVAQEAGRGDGFAPVDVAVYFGEPGVTSPDPYFGGRGPDRTGCIHCGHCMLGCKDNAKNTLDKNYLYLAEQLGAEVRPGCEVTDVRPRGAPGATNDGVDGYAIDFRSRQRPKRRSLNARGVVFAGGVMGTLPLLLKLRGGSLPRLSPRLGQDIRSNSEAIIGAIALDREKDLSQGVAITSIARLDEHSSLEVVRYPRGSGFFRLLGGPHAAGRTALARVGGALAQLLKAPLRNLRAFTVRDFARSSQMLLFMQTLDSTLEFRRGWRGQLCSRLGQGPAPTTSIPMATDYARRFARKLDGELFSLWTETVFGIPTTAHILGGCVMGRDATEGVIDAENRVFGYRRMYVVDGSAISANPGVNPSLTITALAERALSRIPPRTEATEFPASV